MTLPTCALDDCQQRPEIYVESEEWGYPRTKRLCEEHASWAEDSPDFDVLGEERY